LTRSGKGIDTIDSKAGIGMGRLVQERTTFGNPDESYDTFFWGVLCIIQANRCNIFGDMFPKNLLIRFHGKMHEHKMYMF
jgi:hypothetical protein